MANGLITDAAIDPTALGITSNTIPLAIGGTGITQAFISPSNLREPIDNLLEEYSLNRITVDHKVTGAELLKLQEVAPDYASEIKEQVAKRLARDVAKKVSYTKRHDKDADVHHFIGRVWVFTEDELKTMLGKR